ncbi:T9SS type A sorting domain-containing protein [Aquimarina sp. 2201CG14-23]|uniref:T9SS type A sorting domain-containing protein n=1 Tax=Aquimarina mycalae TaxID=3040073 RepID=UPI002477E634|nr:T9SS type A sorting domain-containing protein [Aquimarina sp. 2201CG14-23]MDH7444840.1 T9SS type A sorting domain-containing protein [Aquimarina sp. 2201CG14-23]
MKTKLNSYGMAIVLALCCSLPVKSQGYTDADIQKIGSDRDSSKDRENLTIESSSNTRTDDVSLIFVGQSDSNSLDGVRPSGIHRITRDGHESSFSDVNLQTYYYVHDRNGSKRFNFGDHKRGFVYLVTLRNVDLNALRGIRSDRSSDYRWTNANTNRKYGRNDEWRSGCGSGKYRGLAYVNKEIKSYDKGVQIAAVMYDDNPVNIGIYRSRTSNTKIMNVLESWRQGDDAMAIGMKTTDGSRTDELHFRGTDCVRGNGENVLASFTLKPGSGSNPNPDNDWLIDNCDRESGWSSANTKSISSNFKEGSGSLKSRGSRTDDFKRIFETTNGQGATALEFWYYVDNPSRFDSSNQVELGSDGRPDSREYNWNIDKSTLNNGWNLIRLPFADARITGGTPDITRLNWFRLYRRKNATTTSRIDFIRLTSNSSRLKTENHVGLGADLKQNYKLYPNPSKGAINIHLPMNDSNGNATISITNIMGQIVYSKEYNGLLKGNNQIAIDTQLSAALYLVEIDTKESRRVLRLVIKE